MKFHIETMITILLLAIILFTCCSGCGVKSTSDQVEMPADTTHDETPVNEVNPIKTKENRERKINPIPREKIAKLSPDNFSDLEYLATLKGVEYVEIAREKRGIPYPWDPIVVPIEWWKKQIKKSGELLVDLRQKNITVEEYNEIVFKYHREYGLVASMRLNIELNGGSIDDGVSKLINIAYTENPDDYDTFLLWVYAGGNILNPYGEEKVLGICRLYEMNSKQEWVLFKLARCILQLNTHEAIRYAQKAQELDARYLPLAVEGLYSYQIGDYEEALISFRRSHQNAVKTLQRWYIIEALGSWVTTAKRAVKSGTGEDVRQKIKYDGIIHR